VEMEVDSRHVVLDSLRENEEAAEVETDASSNPTGGQAMVEASVKENDSDMADPKNDDGNPIVGLPTGGVDEKRYDNDIPIVGLSDDIPIVGLANGGEGEEPNGDGVNDADMLYGAGVFDVELSDDLSSGAVNNNAFKDGVNNDINGIKDDSNGINNECGVRMTQSGASFHLRQKPILLRRSSSVRLSNVEFRENDHREDQGDVGGGRRGGRGCSVEAEESLTSAASVRAVMGSDIETGGDGGDALTSRMVVEEAQEEEVDIEESWRSVVSNDNNNNNYHNHNDNNNDDENNNSKSNDVSDNRSPTTQRDLKANTCANDNTNNNNDDGNDVSDNRSPTTQRNENATTCACAANGNPRLLDDAIGKIGPSPRPSDEQKKSNGGGGGRKGSDDLDDDMIEAFGYGYNFGWDGDCPEENSPWLWYRDAVWGCEEWIFDRDEERRAYAAYVHEYGKTTGFNKKMAAAFAAAAANNPQKAATSVNGKITYRQEGGENQEVSRIDVSKKGLVFVVSWKHPRGEHPSYLLVVYPPTVPGERGGKGPDCGPCADDPGCYCATQPIFRRLIDGEAQEGKFPASILKSGKSYVIEVVTLDSKKQESLGSALVTFET